MAKKKLLGRAGETLLETLASMLVIVLGALMLAGAIIAGARVNNSAESVQTFAQRTGAGGEAITVTVEMDMDGYSKTYEANKMMGTKDGELIYYEPN